MTDHILLQEQKAKAFSQIQERKISPSNWVYIVPIDNLEIFKEIGYEIKVRDVTFISTDKLSRVRRRFGIPIKISEFTKHQYQAIEDVKTVAVLRRNGVAEQVRRDCFDAVVKELFILSSSQLGFGWRRSGSYPTIKGEVKSGIKSEILISPDDKFSITGGELVGKYYPLQLTGHWKEFHEEYYFQKLLRIINGKYKISNNWIRDLERASILIGKSFCSTDLATCFLWNVVALEILLTDNNDKITNVLPERAEAMLGWVGFWETDNFEERISEIYKKRSAFVHRGEMEQITVADLLFTDDLLFNLLSNIVSHLELFSSKQKIIEFSKKIQAERLLGIKSKVRPKTLHFLRKKYTDDDLHNI